MTPAATAAARRAATAPRPAGAAAAPARRPARAPASRSQRARIVPHAVGRTVSGLADTGVFVRLTRGRLWIGVLTVLLVGIVAINVISLSFGATASRLGRDADGLRRVNSALRAQLAGQLSDLRIQGAAIRAGLIVPAAGSIRYLHVSPNDAAIAAKRLSSGELVLGSADAALTDSTAALTAATTVPTSIVTTTAPTATTAATTATTVPTTTPTTVVPTTPTTPTTTPTTTPLATTGGGVTAP
jgi:hypothetical protein